MRTAMVEDTATMVAMDMVITENLTKDSMAVFTIKDMEGTAIDYYLRNVNALMLIRKFITQ